MVRGEGMELLHRAADLVLVEEVGRSRTLGHVRVALAARPSAKVNFAFLGFALAGGDGDRKGGQSNTLGHVGKGRDDLVVLVCDLCDSTHLVGEVLELSHKLKNIWWLVYLMIMSFIYVIIVVVVVDGEVGGDETQEDDDDDGGDEQRREGETTYLNFWIFELLKAVHYLWEDSSWE
jgi:hypothetical protein